MEIDLRPGIDWNHLPVGHVVNLVRADDLMTRLSDLRSQWEEATNGKMTKVELNLESLFTDIEEIITGSITPTTRSTNP